MRKEKSPEDLTIDELRQLMVEKRRKVRKEHLEQFRKTGRVVSLASDVEPNSFQNLHSATQTEELEAPLPWYKRTRRFLDGFLLAVEVLAVLGLIFVLFNGIQVLRNLNMQFAQSLVPATMTPTPLIVPVILPSGHTPPNSPGGAQPNEAEIPAHLLPLYQSLSQIPIPTPGPEQAIQLQIPAIKVDAPVVQGDGWEQLKKGIAQHTGTANPGQPGNMVVSAHNDVYGEIFRYLDQLNKGDKIIVFTAQHAYTYLIESVEIVEPTDVAVMASTINPTLTLISCYPYLVDNHRIVVQGSLEANSK